MPDSLVFEKFPDLKLAGRRLIWDSRQLESGEPELVFLHSELSSENSSKLKKRKNAQFVGPLGSGEIFESKDVNLELGYASAIATSHASQKISIFAITGTNGKTTTVALLRHLFLENGLNVCELGTLGLKLWNKENPAKPAFTLETGFTTPTAPSLHALFQKLCASKFEVVVMEASSHAMALGRISGIDFDGAVFTNITQDHLDFHGDMKSYAKAKASLFTHYLSGDFKSLFGIQKSVKRKFSFLHKVSEADDFFHEIESSKQTIPGTITQFIVSDYVKNLCTNVDGAVFELCDPHGTNQIKPVQFPLIGSYNLENFLGAYLVASQYRQMKSLNFSRFGSVEGRLEKVKLNSTFRKNIWIDYAHTPDALSRSLSTLKVLLPEAGKLMVVFGCGGDRDKGKRQSMGKIASELADQIFITSDNPRSENPSDICEQIKSGVPTNLLSATKTIEDRKVAIQTAIKNMGESDFLLIAGKGHENYQIIGNKKLPFSDYEVARETFNI